MKSRWVRREFLLVVVFLRMLPAQIHHEDFLPRISRPGGAVFLSDFGFKGDSWAWKKDGYIQAESSKGNDTTDILIGPRFKPTLNSSKHGGFFIALEMRVSTQRGIPKSGRIELLGKSGRPGLVFDFVSASLMENQLDVRLTDTRGKFPVLLATGQAPKRDAELWTGYRIKISSRKRDDGNDSILVYQDTNGVQSTTPFLAVHDTSGLEVTQIRLSQNQVGIEIGHGFALRGLEADGLISPIGKKLVDAMVNSSPSQMLPVQANIEMADAAKEYLARRSFLEEKVGAITEEDQQRFEDESKSSQREISDDYFTKWCDIFSARNITLDKIPKKPNYSQSLRLQLNARDVKSLASHLDVRHLELIEEGKSLPTNSELMNISHLAPYAAPTVPGNPLSPQFVTPSASTLWGTTWGNAWKGNKGSQTGVNAIKIATCEAGIPSSYLGGIANVSSNSYTPYTNPVAGGTHSEMTFLNMARAAPDARKFHFSATSYSGCQSDIIANSVQIMSISMTNSPGRGSFNAQYWDWINLAQDNFFPPFTLVVGPADNGGQTVAYDTWAAGCACEDQGHISLVNWGGYNSLSVGDGTPDGRVGPLTAYTQHTGRCSSGENWPPSIYDNAGNLSPEPDHELPHIVAPGSASTLMQDFAGNPIYSGDAAIADPLTQYRPICGTSNSAPHTVGVIASLMTQFPAFSAGWPEIGKVTAMLTAVNATGPDQYNVYDANTGHTIDQIDGTGMLDAFQAGNFVNAVKNIRTYPFSHPNASPAQQRGISYFWMVKGLVNGSGQPVNFNGNDFDASNSLRYDILVPTSLSGRHLRAILTWQPIIRHLGGLDQVDYDDFDIVLTNSSGAPLLASNNYQGTSYENNVEVVDWFPTTGMQGQTVRLNKLGPGLKLTSGQAGKIRAVLAWEWVKNQSR